MTKNNTPTEFDDVTAELWQQDRHGERLEMIHRLNQIEEIIREQSGAVLGEDRQARLTQSIRDACGEIRALPDTIAEGESERLKIPIHVCLVDFQNQSPAVMMPTLKAGIDEVLGMLDQYAARTPDYYGSGEAEKNQLHPADNKRKRGEWLKTAKNFVAAETGYAADDKTRKRITQSDIANHCGVDKSAVSKKLNPKFATCDEDLIALWDNYEALMNQNNGVADERKTQGSKNRYDDF